MKAMISILVYMFKIADMRYWKLLDRLTRERIQVLDRWLNDELKDVEDRMVKRVNYDNLVKRLNKKERI